LTGIAANVDLPAPGASKSLGANKAIEINTDGPKVLSISTSKANGVYGVGAIIPIEVILNKPVSLTGGKLIATLNNGVEIEIEEQSGSTISILYVVGVNEEVEDLDVLSLTLTSGASIKDASDRTLDIAFASNSFATLFDITIKEETTTTTDN